MNKPENTASLNQAYIGLRQEIVQQVPASAKTILDVGCSNGVLGAKLRELDADRAVLGIENDPALADQAKSRLSRVFVEDVDEFEWEHHFGNVSFDCMIFADVLEHLADPWGVLQRAVGCLAADGTVIISLPNIRHISAFYAIYMTGTFPLRDRGTFDRTHLRWFTLKDAMHLCGTANLDPVAVHSSLRLRDKPGGKLNYLAAKLGRFQGFYPVRQFLSYQFIITAVPRV